MDYKKAGIDLDKMGKLKERILGTYEVMLKGHYSPVLKLDDENYYSIHTDGVGTKVLVAEALGKFDTLGIDAVAMNVNDMACINCTPTAGVDYLAVSEENDEVIEQMVKGVVEGCRKSRITLAGGETAVMSEVVNGYDLTFTCVGFGKLKELVTGERIREGDQIIGLESSGLHSNGFTLARKILDLEEFGKQMLEPTLIYSNAVLEAAKQFKINGMAHITGGAFTKLKRLSANHDFVIDNMPEPKGIFKTMAESVKDSKELYRVFNMGIGFVVIAEQENSDNIIWLLGKHGLKASVIGKIEKGTGKTIVNDVQL